MNIQRLAAFTDQATGGNPAGVVLTDTALPETEMARIAAEVGYSETAFASPANESQPDPRDWRVRYFSPESEVPFCGHATIALGAALTRHVGEGSFALSLNAAKITVSGEQTGTGYSATLASPPTQSRTARSDELSAALELFALTHEDLDPRLPPAHIHAGAAHLVLVLRERAQLARMRYDLDAGRQMMRAHGLVTIMLVHISAPDRFDARNAFASGGVLEDPATGAAAAAFAGYLRDQAWNRLDRDGGQLVLIQGEDMGARSRIKVKLTAEKGASVQISGTVSEIAP